MNEELIKFIELCLSDGVITDKEREVIFRKSKELGVPDDECEIILEGMIHQKEGVNEVLDLQKTTIKEKKTLEFELNNLNQKKILNNEIENLNLKLKRKEKLLDES